MLRKIVAALILVPLAIILVAFAVANRHFVTVSLDPFSADRPAAALTMPLFALVIVLLIVGVTVGGVAAWLGQSKWRRLARRLERELGDLRREVETFKRTEESANIADQINPPPRLALRPPMR